MENTTKAEKMEKGVGRCDDITHKDGTSTCSSELVIKIEKDEQSINQGKSTVNQLDHDATSQGNDALALPDKTKLTKRKEEIVLQTEPDESDLINDILSVLQNSSGDYDAPGCLVIQPKIDSDSSQIEDVIANGLPGRKTNSEKDGDSSQVDNVIRNGLPSNKPENEQDEFPHIKEEEIELDAIKKEEDCNETSSGIKRKNDDDLISDTSSPAKRPASIHTVDDEDSNISTSLSSVTSRNGVTVKNATAHKSTSNTSSVSKSSWIVKGVKDATKSGTSKVNFKSKINSSHFCSVCKKVFTNSRLLAEHISTKHGSTTSTCKICGKSFVDATYLAKHMSLNHNPNSAVKYTCTLCLEVSYTLPDYKAHMSKHYKETSSNCDKKMSVNSNELKSENNNCSSGDEQTESSYEKSFFCVVCRYVSRGLASYVKHLEQHNNITDAAVQSFECSHCGMLFGNKGSLANHAKVHDAKGESLIEYDCGFCDETFATQRQLSDHLQVHTGSNLPMKPHVCSTCGKAFAKKCVLWIHEKIHSEPQYECQVCNKKFTTRTQRINHERVHNGQRPYACSVCAKRFKTLDAVNNHELTHSDARPCKCVICGKGFRRKDHLNRHLQTHSGAQERPFPCHLCENRFQDKHRLNLHLKAHEKGKTRRPRKLKSNNTDKTTDKSKSKGRKKRRRKNENSDDTSDDDGEHSDASNSPSRSTETSGDKLRNDGSRSYSCKTCHMTFKRESALKAHSKTHEDDDNEDDDSDLDDSELDD